MIDTAILDELTNWEEYSKIFIAVFILVSPPIIVPLFLGVMGGRSPSEKIGAALVGALGFAVITISFTFLGRALLELFGITLGAFRFAGGVLLMLIALDMMKASEFNKIEPDKDPHAGWIALGIVPIAIPILAGPGAISSIVIFASQHDTLTHRFLITTVLVVIAIYIAAVLSFAAVTNKLFSRLLSTIFNRIMGLIVLAVAFEFIMDGIAEHFPILGTVHQQ